MICGVLLVALGFDPVAHAAGRSVDGQSLYGVSTGWGAEGVYVRTVVAAPVVDGCGGTAYILEPGHPLMKEMVSLLLSAMQSGMAVDLYVDGYYSGDVMKLKAVSLHK